ncbi:SRPBCC family protein [Naasia sp. SYSU D00948]|uniref:SRPBCC family protein n=1 Tax=Naasia sp. SYSU D00948 TaxID=2817379 RepID=UPI001B312168|nr:SRPBCC family protein [Naasia sp. SYSU D00948]
MPTTDSTIIKAPEALPVIEITRDFEAPLARVFQAFTDPDLIPEWLGPRELTTVVDRFDARSGGSYRYVQRDPDGNEYAFHGCFHTVEAPTTVIQTWEFEGYPGEVSLEYMHLESLGDTRTRGHFTSHYRTLEARNGLIASGMERGLRDSHLRLDELLARA